MRQCATASRPLHTKSGALGKVLAIGLSWAASSERRRQDAVHVPGWIDALKAGVCGGFLGMYCEAKSPSRKHNKTELVDTMFFRTEIFYK